MSTSAADFNKCLHCGMGHTGRCPQVKAVEYYPNGQVKRIEYVTPGDFVAPLGVPIPPFKPLEPPYVVTVGGSHPTDTTITWTKPYEQSSGWAVYPIDAQVTYTQQ